LPPPVSALAAPMLHLARKVVSEQRQVDPS
jgi:hypothetical protein